VSRKNPFSCSELNEIPDIKVEEFSGGAIRHQLERFELQIGHT